MKKNAISKVLLLFVLMALIFSLCACSNNGDNGKGSGSGGAKALSAPEFTTQEPATDGTVTWLKVSGAASYEYVITDENGTERTGTITEEGKGTIRSVKLNEGESIKVRAIPEDTAKFKTGEWSITLTSKMTSAKQVLNMLTGVRSLVNTWNDVTVTSTLGAELAIGGYFNDNSLALSLKANANKDNPEALVEFILNETSYFVLACKSSGTGNNKKNKVYVREPLNFINTDEDAANSFVMDVTALAKECLPELMTPVMEMLASDKTDIDFDTMIYDQVAGFLNNETLSGAINGILDEGLKQNDDGTTTLGITIDLLATAIPMLSMIPGDIGGTVDKVIGYANKGLEVLNKAGIVSFDKLQFDGNDVTYEYITTEMFSDANIADIKENSLLNIVFSTKNSVLNKVALELDLGAFGIESVNYKMGLTIDLPLFSLSEKSSIVPSDGDYEAFTAQDLVVDLTGALPFKGLDAKATGVIRLSNGLAAKGNKWADLTVTSTGNKVSTAYINDTGAYVDFTGIFQTLGMDTTANAAKFKAEYVFDDEEIDSMIDQIIAYAKSINEPVEEVEEPEAEEPEAEEPEAEEPAAEEEVTEGEDEGFDFNGIIALVTSYVNAFNSAEDKADYVSDIIISFISLFDEEAVFEEEGGQAALIKYVFEDIELGDTDSYIKDYVKFYTYEEEDEEEQIVVKKAKTFQKILDNIQACHEAGKAKLDAAVHAENKTAGAQVIGIAAENEEDAVPGLLDYVAEFIRIPTIVNDEPDFQNLGEINNPEVLIAWLNWIFPTDNEYRVMVEDILGLGLSEIINGGLYVEAQGFTGLHGKVLAAPQAGAETAYVTLEGEIDIKGGSEAVADITGEFVEFTAEADDEYVIATTAKAMLDALRAFGK